MAEGEDWTGDEVDAVVTSYFDYFWGEDPPPKAQVFKKLHDGPIPGRSEKSIERKFRNVSAILDERTLRWIHGLAPDAHYQALLGERVDHYLEQQRKSNYRRFQESHPNPDIGFGSQTWRRPLQDFLARLFIELRDAMKCYGTTSDADKQQTRLVQQGGKARFLSISFSKGRQEHDAFVEIVKSSKELWALPAVSCVAISYAEGGQWHLGSLVHRPKSPFPPMVQAFLKVDVATHIVSEAAPDHLAPLSLGVALNTILHGPPGTGKTYATLERSLAICGVPYTDRNTALSEYRKLVDAGRIRFVTFHQSFAYEDFVEGIRPIVDEETGQVIYEPRDGVFKELCSRAASRRTGGSTIDGIEGRRFWKMSLGNTRLDETDVYQRCLEEGLIKLGWGSGTDFSGCETRTAVFERLKQDEPEIGPNDYRVTAVNIFKNEITPGDLVIVSDGNHKFRAIAETTGNYEFTPEEWGQRRSVKWLATFDPSLPREQLFHKAISQMTLYELKPATLKLDQLASLVAGKPSSDAEPCVLIIDEINRANISKVFGELITLLEQDKRVGGRDEKTVILPYSREEFGVPPNVFVIGTMNTADRSIATLDIALRRRFDFVEMKPRPDLVESVAGEIDGISPASLLARMNERIEFLLDRDHCLGHSYFMAVGSLDDLGDVLKTKVVPLLQEYFHGDFRKVAWVLGCGYDEEGVTQNANPIVVAKTASSSLIFGGDSEFDDRVRAELNEMFIAANGEDFIPFFKGILA
jgi:5-methylcytosine-specific restriction enzyme B